MSPCLLCPASITSAHISWSRQHASVSINLPRSSGPVATLPLPHHFVPAGRKHRRRGKLVTNSLHRFHLDLLRTRGRGPPSATAALFPSYLGISGSFSGPVSPRRRSPRLHCRLYSRSPMREPRRRERGRTRESTAVTATTIPGRACLSNGGAS